MRKLLTNKGYTLIDALAQLMILLLFSNILFFYSVWLKDSERHLTQTETIEWELFSLEIIPYLIDLQDVEEHSNGSGIRILRNGEEYDIEFTGAIIRKQKNRLGNEPMLLHITNSHFQLNGTKLKVAIVFDSGLKKERVYELTFAQE
ncbi:MAG: competence type IV pilus minor pilin ComGF [Paenisporosarcina sp.]